MDDTLWPLLTPNEIGSRAASVPELCDKLAALASFPWNRVDCPRKTLLQCARLLLLKAVHCDYSDSKFSCDLDVELAWHEVMLLPAEYSKLCDRLCGQMIDHDCVDHSAPYLRDERIAKTKVAYNELFGPDENPLICIEPRPGVGIEPFTVPFVEMQISTLKLKIQRLTGIRRNLQRLTYRGRTLDDDYVVSQTETPLELYVGTLVFIRSEIHGSFMMPLYEDWFVADLKTSISKRFSNLPVNSQQLFIGACPMDNKLQLKAFEIQEDTAITFVDLSCERCLMIETSQGNKFIIVFRSEDQLTVHDLKTKIAVHYRVPPEQQRLIFGGEQLEDDQLISKYGITGQQTVSVISRLRRPRHA